MDSRKGGDQKTMRREKAKPSLQRVLSFASIDKKHEETRIGREKVACES